MIKLKSKDYLKNEFLLKEISKSKENVKNYPERLLSECLTPGLVNSIVLLTEKYAQKFNWRGYSWIEDMKADAVASLCQIALKFDETKSINPFGYYTQCITRSFVNYINNEKKQSRIKDDLIEFSVGDMEPSWTRQNEENDAHLDGTKRIPSDPLIRRRNKKRERIEYLPKI